MLGAFQTDDLLGGVGSLPPGQRGQGGELRGRRDIYAEG